MRTITRSRWDRLHRDYKMVQADGTRWVLARNESGATVLESVIIEDSRTATAATVTTSTNNAPSGVS